LSAGSTGAVVVGYAEDRPGERRRGPVGIARAPEERAALLAQSIERADEREVAEGLLLQSDPPREVVERPERPALALTDDRVRLRFAEPLHLNESEPDVMGAARAMSRDGVRSIDHVVIRGVRCAVRRAVTGGRGVS